MPFVTSLPPEAYDPITLRSLIARYDAIDDTRVDSNDVGVLGAPGGVLAGGIFKVTKILDKRPYKNNLVATNVDGIVAEVRAGVTVGIAFLTLSNSFFLNKPTEFRYPTTGVTLFFVGTLGFPGNPTDIMSIFGTRDSSLARSNNAVFLSIDSNNRLFATNNNIGAGTSVQLKADRNAPKIITASFGKYDSTNFGTQVGSTLTLLRINGIDYGETGFTQNNFDGLDNDYLIQIGTPNNNFSILPDNFGASNSFNLFSQPYEVLVYNSRLSINEINRIEEYLARKWSRESLVEFAGTPDILDIYRPVQYGSLDYRLYPPPFQIPHLLLWLDPKNRSNLSFGNPDQTDITEFFSSESNGNFFTYDSSVATTPFYNSNDRRINFDGRSPLYSGIRPPIDGGTSYQEINPLNPGMGNIYGVTIYTLLSVRSSAFPIATILTVFAPSGPGDLDGSTSYPITSFPNISQNNFGEIFAGSNIYDTIFESRGFNMGESDIPSHYRGEPFVLTTQFTETHTRMWANGYPILNIEGPGFIKNAINLYLNPFGLSLGPLPLVGFLDSMACYIGGVPNIAGGVGAGYITCQTEIGEVLIYKTIPNRLDTMNEYLYSNYNISRTLSSNGLVDWWDADDIIYNESGSNVVMTWTGKYNNNILSNISSDSIPYLRRYYTGTTNITSNYIDLNSRTHNFVDFNNGNPSAMVCPLNNILMESSNVSIFMVTTGSFNSNGVILQTRSSNILDVEIKSLYDIGFEQETFMLSKARTNLASSNQLYITTFSIVDSNVVNIYTIPSRGENFVDVDDAVPLSNTTTNYLTVGADYTIGSNPSNYFRNSIGELIVYNRALSNGEYTNILAYLQSKWAFPIQSYGPPDSIPGLNLWYDANNNTGFPNSIASVDVSRYGPNLAPTSGSGPISTETIGNNDFVILGNARITHFLNPITITQNYTYFIVTRHSSTGTTSNGSIVFFRRVTPSPIYPGLYYSNDRYMITETADNVISFSNSDKCYSLFSDTVNYPDATQSNINITCINHTFDGVNRGSYTITSKGTLYQKSCNNVYEEPLTNTSNVFLGFAGAFTGMIPPDGRRYNGSFGEFLFYNRSLTNLEELSVFKYLEGKWLNDGGPFNPCF